MPWTVCDGTATFSAEQAPFFVLVAEKDKPILQYSEMVKNSEIKSILLLWSASMTRIEMLVTFRSSIRMLDLKYEKTD